MAANEVTGFVRSGPARRAAATPSGASPTLPVRGPRWTRGLSESREPLDRGAVVDRPDTRHGERSMTSYQRYFAGSRSTSLRGRAPAGKAVAASTARRATSSGMPCPSSSATTSGNLVRDRAWSVRVRSGAVDVAITACHGAGIRINRRRELAAKSSSRGGGPCIRHPGGQEVLKAMSLRRRLSRRRSTGAHRRRGRRHARRQRRRRRAGHAGRRDRAVRQTLSARSSSGRSELIGLGRARVTQAELELAHRRSDR